MAYAYDDQNIFAKILRGEIPNRTVLETEHTLAFEDIHPQAPVHVLVIPKKHVASLAEADKLSAEELAACLRVCAKVAEQEGLTEKGFRVVSNCGDDACQSVHHLHFHVLGGAPMGEKLL